MKLIDMLRAKYCIDKIAIPSLDIINQRGYKIRKKLRMISVDDFPDDGIVVGVQGIGEKVHGICHRENQISGWMLFQNQKETIWSLIH